MQPEPIHEYCRSITKLQMSSSVICEHTLFFVVFSFMRPCRPRDGPIVIIVVPRPRRGRHGHPAEGRIAKRAQLLMFYYYNTMIAGGHQSLHVSKHLSSQNIITGCLSGAAWPRSQVGGNRSLLLGRSKDLASPGIATRGVIGDGGRQEIGREQNLRRRCSMIAV
jgi:hypothetical protein